MAGKILLLKFATYPLAEVQISGVQNYYIFISEDWSAEEDSKNWSLYVRRGRKGDPLTISLMDIRLNTL